MDTPALAHAVETQEPEPLLSRQQFRAKLRELQDQAEKREANLAELQQRNQAMDQAGRQLSAQFERARQLNRLLIQDFTTAIRTAWPRLTDAEKAPLLEFWKRLGHKDPPGPMSGLVLVGG